MSYFVSFLFCPYCVRRLHGARWWEPCCSWQVTDFHHRDTCHWDFWRGAGFGVWWRQLVCESSFFKHFIFYDKRSFWLLDLSQWFFSLAILCADFPESFRKSKLAFSCFTCCVFKTLTITTPSTSVNICPWIKKIGNIWKLYMCLQLFKSTPDP